MLACRRGTGGYTARDSRCHAKASQDSPQEGSVDGILGLGEVGKAHKQRGVLLPCQFLQATLHEHYIDRRTSEPKAPLLCLQEPFPFAVVAEAARDEFEEYFTGVRDKADATIVSAIRPVFLLVQHVKRCILSLLRHYPSSPHSEVDLVQTS